jgi:methylated-DNA-[protein]-cysteine S-methyltransferase
MFRATLEARSRVVARGMDHALFRSRLKTPLGMLTLTVNGDGTLVEVLLPNRPHPAMDREPLPTAAQRGMRAATTQLIEYFGGRRRVFDLRIAATGSPFERQVWNKLLTIPYGATTSYGAVAAELEIENGARAVGRANGANPIPIVIPCHRVIGSDGGLTGYGGGLALKRALLELEGAIRPEDPRLF